MNRSSSITTPLRTLCTLRWVAIAGQVVAVWLAVGVLRLEFPLLPLAAGVLHPASALWRQWRHYALLGLLVAMVALGPWLEALILIGNALLVIGVLRYLRGPVLEPLPAMPRKPAASQRSHPPGRTPARAASAAGSALRGRQA